MSNLIKEISGRGTYLARHQYSHPWSYRIYVMAILPFKTQYLQSTNSCAFFMFLCFFLFLIIQKVQRPVLALKEPFLKQSYCITTVFEIVVSIIGPWYIMAYHTNIHLFHLLVAFIDMTLMSNLGDNTTRSGPTTSRPKLDLH